MLKDIALPSGSQYTVELAAASHVVSFRAFHVIGTTSDGTKTFERKNDADPWSNPVLGAPTEDCLVFAEGHVKWDGCSNIQFPEQNEVMLHNCNRAGLTDIGELLGAIYDACGELLGDNWRGE